MRRKTAWSDVGNFGAGKNNFFIGDFDTPLLGLNKCRRCGEWIEENRLANKPLWCDTCRKLVDKELQGKTNRPFEYFFEYYRIFEKKEKED